MSAAQRAHADSEHRETDAEEFAAAVVHALRTPLAALSGEVELALRRERSRLEYRDTLERIALRIAELVDMSGDLGFLSQLRDERVPQASVALDEVFARLAERFGPRRGQPVIFTLQAWVAVAGQQRLITGALALLIECAIRQRGDGKPVHVSAVPDASAVAIRIETSAGGFARYAELAGASSPGRVPFDAADRAIQACGGSIEISASARDAVVVRLRRAAGPRSVSPTEAGTAE